MSIEVIHQTKVLPTDTSLTQRIVVHRKAYDTLDHFHSGIDFHKHLRIVFVGESAVDNGGPTREFLYLLMGEIAANNSLFSGKEDCRLPFPNMSALERQTYKHIGEMMSTSLVPCSMQQDMWHRGLVYHT